MSLKIAALPAAALALLGLVAVLPDGGTEARSPRTTTVTQSSYACPTGADATIATGRLTANAGAKATAIALPGEKSVASLAKIDSWNQQKVDADAVVVSSADAKGAGAVGFSAVEGDKDDGGGLAVSPCAGVTQDAWYLGAGSGGRHFSTVTLTNLADAPSIVDISMWGDRGVIDAIDAEGIVLDPLETRRVKLDDLAAGEPQLAVRVRSRRGAISVNVNDNSKAVFAGSEQISPTATASKRFVIPGLVPGSGGRELLAFNPGTATARVKIESLGKEGPFAPTGLDDTKVPAGKLRVIELPSSVGKDATALRLTSDVPLTASVRMAPTNKDFAYAVAGEAIAGPAILPASIGKDFDDLRMLLTAPGAASTVSVTAYDETMAARGTVEVEVEAGSTRSYDLAKKGRFDDALDDIAYLVVTPNGRVHGAGFYEIGEGVSTVPLVAAPLKTQSPDVRPAR